MSTDIFEGSDVIVKATVRKGKLKNADAAVVFFHDGTEKHREATSFANGKLEVTYTAPDVEDGANSYKLTMKIEYDGKEHRYNKTYIVWLKTVDITAKTENDKDVEGFHCNMVQKRKKTASPETDAAGKVTVDLVKPTKFTIKDLAPFSILEQKAPTDGRARELVVQRNFVAEFKNPTVADPNDPIKQNVNLVTADEGRDKKSNVIIFEVGAKDPADAGEGDVVNIEVKFGLESKRNSPVPKLLDEEDAEDVAMEDDGKLYKGLVRLKANAGPAKFKVDLGLAGGDTCEVRIGGTKDSVDDESLKFVNWRMLDYEVRYPQFMEAEMAEVDLAAGGKGRDFPEEMKRFADARLGKGFVEYKLLKSCAVADASVEAGTRVPAAYIGNDGAGDNYILTSSWLNSAGHFDPAADNRVNHVSVCHGAYSTYTTVESKTKTLKKKTGKLETTDLDEIFEFEPDSAPGTTNLTLRGWEAVITPADHMKATKLEFVAAGPEAGAVTAGTAQVVETTQTKDSDLDFVDPSPAPAPVAAPGVAPGPPPAPVPYTDVSPGDLAKIKAFLIDAMSDEPALRQNENTIKVKVITSGTTAEDNARFASIKAAVEAEFATIDKKIAFHPGLDDNGVARKGALDASWFDFTIKAWRVGVELGTRASAADPLLPGDFVGPKSDTTCPVKYKVRFKSTYAINGNSGGGSQLMVWRDSVPAPWSSTLCHELGHAMGMTAFDYPVPPGMDAAKNVDNGGPYYKNGSPQGGGLRGLHKGPHCAHGVSRRNLRDNKFKGKQGSCIMWGSGGNDDTRQNWCPTCEAYLRGRQLDDIRSGWAGRAAP